MNDVWSALTKYQTARDQFEKIKQEVAGSLALDDESQERLEQLELELIETKAYIQLNFNLKRVD